SPARRAVFWFDAHGDLHTPATTGSGFLDGTGLATAMGLGFQALASSIPGFVPVAPDDVFLLGARDLDAPEAELVAASPMTHLPPAAVSELGDVLRRAP